MHTSPARGPKTGKRHAKVDGIRLRGIILPGNDVFEIGSVSGVGKLEKLPTLSAAYGT